MRKKQIRRVVDNYINILWDILYSDDIYYFRDLYTTLESKLIEPNTLNLLTNKQIDELDSLHYCMSIRYEE